MKSKNHDKTTYQLYKSSSSAYLKRRAHNAILA